MQPDFREVASSIGLQTAVHPRRRPHPPLRHRPAPEEDERQLSHRRRARLGKELGDRRDGHLARSRTRAAPPPHAADTVALARPPDAQRKRPKRRWPPGWLSTRSRRRRRETHPYLERKGFPKTLGLVYEGLLLVPARIDGQVVLAAGDRRRRHEEEPARRHGCAAHAFSIGSGRLEVLCEGYATGLSIKAALAALCTCRRA